MPRKNVTAKVVPKFSLSFPIETGLDQPNRQPDADKILGEVQSTVRYAKRENSLELALAFAGRIDKAINLGGKALGYALYCIQKEFFPEEGGKLSEEFVETMLAKTGKAPDTIRKYHRVGETLEYMRTQLAPEVRQQWLDRPIQDLIALGQARREHGDFTLREISKLAKAPDNSSLRKSLRELSGKDEGESTVLLVKVRRDGTLVAYQGDDQEEIGQLYDKCGELGQKAIARIMRRSSIQES